jgi:hypothetical protein
LREIGKRPQFAFPGALIEALGGEEKAGEETREEGNREPQLAEVG